MLSAPQAREGQRMSFGTPKESGQSINVCENVCLTIITILQESSSELPIIDAL